MCMAACCLSVREGCLLCWFIVQVNVPQSRYYHSAAAFSISPGFTQVTIFGECPVSTSNCKSDADLPQMANTTVLRFGESTSCVILNT